MVFRLVALLVHSQHRTAAEPRKGKQGQRCQAERYIKEETRAGALILTDIRQRALAFGEHTHSGSKSRWVAACIIQRASAVGTRAKPNDSESSSTTQIRKSGKMLQRRQDCTHSIAHTQLQGIGRFKASGKPCTFERGVHGGWRKILQESRVPVPKCQTNRTCAGVLCGTAGANSSGAGMLCCMSGSTRRTPGPATRPLPPACSAQSIAALHLALQGILNTKPHLLCSFILATHTGWGSTPH